MTSALSSTYDRAKYLRYKAERYARGVTSNGKPWKPRPVLTFDQRLRLAADRFWLKADCGDTGCWLWTSGRNRAGYGKFTVAGRTISAHRVAYLLAKGGIPDGFLVCHECDTPACINPAHLWLGTAADNMDDKVAKGRQSRGSVHAQKCRHGNAPRGSRQWQAKLTEGDVELLRDMRSQGASLKQLATQFGICKQSVHDVITRKSWAHVP